MNNTTILHVIILVIIVSMIIQSNYQQMKIWILNRLIVQRGILAPNCFWYKISDLLLEDGAGVNLYNDLKEKDGDFPLTYQFNEEIYLVNNVGHIKTILDNSPTIFGVGKLKKTFFSSFMKNNVGVSQGCPWKRRRYITEVALDTDKLHQDSDKYNEYLHNYINKWKDKSTLDYSDFTQLGRYMVAKIVFGVDSVPEDVFNMFSEANTTSVLLNPIFQINPKIKNNYLKVLNYYIDNPQPNSLVKLCLSVSNDREEILHQIPHFIFPIVGLFITTIPRILVLLCNHKDILEKVIREINSIDEPHKLLYTRYCILETVRLINPLITTFRTLLQDFTFDDKYSFKKGTQFLILNNPVLREKEYFEKPNQFIPERWTPEMEKSYYAISFNQGPQRCPGKELVISLCQSFLYNFFRIKKFTSIETVKVDTNYIPQIINPCTIYFKFK